jgi:hypothetical protein
MRHFALIFAVGTALSCLSVSGAPKPDYRHPRPSGAVEPGVYGEKTVDFSSPKESAGIQFDTVLHFPGSEVPAFQIEKVTVNGVAATRFLAANNSIFNFNHFANGNEDLTLSVETQWKPDTEYQFTATGKTASGKTVSLSASGKAPSAPSGPLGLSFGMPRVEFPYHQATLSLAADSIGSGTVTQVDVDGKKNRDTRFFNRPHHARASVKEAESYKGRLFDGQDCRLVIPCNWTNGSTHTVEVTVTLDSGAKKSFKASGTAPGAGGYWNALWPHSVSITLRETAGILRQGEPVHLMLGFFADDITNPTAEIRVVTYDPHSPHAAADGYVVADCQVTSSVTWRDEKVLAIEEKDKDTQERVHRYDPTTTVELVFLADMQPYQEKVYQVLYGNPQAQPQELKTDLVVKPTSGIGRTVETANYLIGLATNSGAMETVKILGKGEPVLLEHKLETNGAVHWNPDFYSPPTPWVHASDWENPEHREINGPLMHRTRSYAPLPHMTDVAAHVSYTFYSGQPYVLCSTLMEVKENLFAQAAREGEIVFNHAVLNEFVWPDPSGTTKSLKFEGARQHPIHALEIPPDTPWMAFINRDIQVGFASILLQYANTNLFGDPVNETQPYIYVQNGPWIYWSRGLVYPFGGLNFTRMMPVRAGSLFLEKNAWVPFRFASGSDPFAEIETLQKELTHPLLKHEWMGTDARTPEKWVMPILTMPFNEGVSGAVSGHKAGNAEKK